MKKLIALFSSIVLCTSMFVGLNTNALYVVVDTTKYEPWLEMDEYTEYANGNFYRAVSGTVASNAISSYYHNDVFVEYQVFSINFSTYYIANEDASLFEKYMASAYPDIAYTKEVNNDRSLCYYLEGLKDRTTDEKFEVAVAIKENTGYKCSYGWLDSTVTATVVGDLSSDNALTPVDASMLLSYYADAQSGVAVASAEGGADYSVLGDFNGDGAVTPTDASEILSYYADQQTAQ